MRQGEAIFLDRDGVINVDYGHVGSIERFEFCEGAISAMKTLYSMGYDLFVVTNQSGIFRSYYSEEDFHNVMKFLIKNLAKEGISLTDYSFCPHGSQENCDCRKPMPKMVLDLANDYKVNLQRSIMVGDNCTDIECAKRAGVGLKILIGTEIRSCKANPDYTFASLKDFVYTFFQNN